MRLIRWFSPIYLVLQKKRTNISINSISSSPYYHNISHCHTVSNTDCHSSTIVHYHTHGRPTTKATLMTYPPHSTPFCGAVFHWPPPRPPSGTPSTTTKNQLQSACSRPAAAIKHEQKNTNIYISTPFGYRARSRARVFAQPMREYSARPHVQQQAERVVVVSFIPLHSPWRMIILAARFGADWGVVRSVGRCRWVSGSHGRGTLHCHLGRDDGERAASDGGVSVGR